MEKQLANLQGKKVLIIDDDFNLRTMLEMTFNHAGAKPITAVNGRDGLRVFFSERPDLIILDLMMPGMNGWEVCQQVRLLSNTPIIMLTTLDRDNDIIRGLEHGADDFVSKPCSPRVLLARASATLRRTKQHVEESENRTTVYDDGYLMINIDNRRVQVQGEDVKLTATEFRLLSYLIENKGRVLTYKQILDKVWGWEYRDSIDYVHVYVSHLRRKLEENSREPAYFLTEHGTGYRFSTHN